MKRKMDAEEFGKKLAAYFQAFADAEAALKKKAALTSETQQMWGVQRSVRLRTQ